MSAHPTLLLGQTDSAIALSAAAPDPGNIVTLNGLSLHDDVVSIGPVLQEDAAALFLWLNDVDAAALDLPYRPVDWISCNDWLTNFVRNPTQVLFAIRYLRLPHIIGFVALAKIQPICRSAEIGLRIGELTDRGSGYGRRAAALALHYAWNHLNLNRVQLSAFASNQAAIRAYRAAGFVEEGLLRQAAFVNGASEDVVLMAALRP